MNVAPSSTWFTTGPSWGWYIVFYFFMGGLAGGSYFLAALIDSIGRPADRPLARIGYYIAFPCVAVSGLLLTIDLGRPLRFWHMLIERNTFGPMFKYWSPMSIGSWALLCFALFSFIAFLGALAEEDRLPSSPLLHRMRPLLLRVRPPGVLGHVVAVLGGLAGLYLAGYTGVLLAVTNRPIWSDTPLLGMLFIVSAASTSAALMILLADRYRLQAPSLAGLHRFDQWVIALEIMVVLIVIASLGPVARAWLNVWGVLLATAILIGMIIPLILLRRAGRPRFLMSVPILVLIGGFLLRCVIIFSSESM